MHAILVSWQQTCVRWTPSSLATIISLHQICGTMAPTATTQSDNKAAAAAGSSFTFDPFASIRSFKYSGSVKAVYPLSPKPKIPPSIRRPNYAREGVRMWLHFWWQVRVPFLTVSLPFLFVSRSGFADTAHASTLLAFLLLGLFLDSLKQFLESRNIKINTKADQDGVRQSATVRFALCFRTTSFVGLFADLATSTPTQLAREVLELAAAAAKPGVTTDEIDKIVFAEAIKRDCYPSPLGYHGYPKSVCT